MTFVTIPGDMTQVIGFLQIPTFVAYDMDA
jgi:hypothetical protein